MIKIQIQHIARKNGLINAYALQRALGCSPTMASRLWKESFKQIELETIQRLCDLFKCQLSDLITVTPKDDIKIAKNRIHTKNQQPVINSVEDGVLGEKLFTTHEIAELLGLNRRTVNDFIVHGKLKATKGKQGRNFVKESDFEVFKKQRVI